jgi:hypothetical protein
MTKFNLADVDSFATLFSMFVKGSPRELGPDEYEGLAGIEGDGYVADVRLEDGTVDDDHFIVADVTEGEIAIQILSNSSDDYVGFSFVRDSAARCSMS